MTNPIPVIEKRDFLKWFLENYQLKRRECAWLLNFLMSDDLLMERVHFVEDAEHCPKALLISANDVEDVPFAFHKNQHITMDAEKAFHDIRLNRNEEIYIQLNFQEKYANSEFMRVLEENHYIPVNEDEENVNRLLAEMVLDASLRQQEMKALHLRIDDALENGDEETFSVLAKEYAKLKALET
ncbi:ReoY family proteolytic degradation factor [Salisediminibacterium selenitireducens]|uniref:UPF0302 protein Bsel_2117 n=1 Tax=Bacillus selenitireducens (strain ATCC 700615 / DSM 15326 / MLS10) TaxID=439292 RepID=D6XUY5_BACIE|nr:ReoY family proteolytic degradation factor [Salisediminibacterium selenitireducens]ADH99621.1 Protein of unknown function UPF0302 [[Bacillus] selenitireducens MLS10]